MDRKKHTTNVLRRSTTNGFAIMEVLISLGMTLLILGSSVSFVSHINKSHARTLAATEESSDLTQVLTYLSNPQYVGRLIDHADNQQLKNCLIAGDGINCGANKKYELQVYDIFNNKILNLQESSGYKGMSFTFEGTCDNLANACDAFSYINIHVTFQKKKEDGTIEETHKTVSVKPVPQNVISLYPQSSVAKGKPINILFLIDTSNSMGYVKGSVAAGLKNLLNSLKDNETYIELGPIFSATLYSTVTGQYKLDGSGNKVALTNAEVNALNHGDIYYKSYKRTPITGGNNAFISRKFSPTMSAADRASTYTFLTNYIDALFTSGSTYNGNPYDIPLCLLMTQLRRIKTGDSNLNKDPQTPTLIYVATNEDDESNLYKVGQKDASITDWNMSIQGSPYCGLSFTERVTALRYMSSTWGTYQAKALSAKMAVKVFYQSDGLETSRTLYLKFVPGIEYKKLDTPSAACPKDIDTAYKGKIDYNISLQFPKDTHTRFEMTSCELINDQTSMMYENPYTVAGDKCNAGYFTQNASLYPGFDVNSCKFVISGEGGQSQTGYSAMGDMTTDSFDGTDLNDAIIKELGSTFPQGNYFMSMAIIPSSGACPVELGSSPGVKFEQLATKLGKKATVVPVCQSKFSNDFIEDAIQHIEVKMGNDVTLDKSILGKVTSIEIVQAGEKKTLEKTKDYSITSSSVIFTNGVLTPETQIFIYYDL